MFKLASLTTFFNAVFADKSLVLSRTLPDLFFSKPKLFWPCDEIDFVRNASSLCAPLARVGIRRPVFLLGIAVQLLYASSAQVAMVSVRSQTNLTSNSVASAKKNKYRGLDSQPTTPPLSLPPPPKCLLLPHMIVTLVF